jgi:trans-L-3-hydroxyproline dehydratase
MKPIREWRPPAGWTRIETVEAHACGEPLRVVAGGLPPIPGATILDKRRHARENLDDLRRALMWEPRGHADMYGAILTEPETGDGDVGVLFLHNEGFSTMCGHGVIALTTVLLETGVHPWEGNEAVIRMDTPAGRVTARARREKGRVRDVTFRNVPSFVLVRDRTADVPGIGTVRYDVAFGGAFYAVVDAQDAGVGLESGNFGRIIDAGMRIKHAVMDSLEIVHPLQEDLGFLYGTILVGPAHDPALHSRNVCVFAEGEVDRSPTGTGVSARAALLFSRGAIGLGDPFVVESILGTRMTGRAVEETTAGAYQAIVPEVTGTASLTGRCEWWIDPGDPLRHGFILR